MEKWISHLIVAHALSGGIALITGLISIRVKKGDTPHKKAGKIYFWSMTGVFISGVIIAGYQFNRFLFLIAFLSYYSVFSGVRFLKLKQLHKTQQPQWYDWAAGILNATANLFFVGLGDYYLVEKGISSGGALLSLGFGLGGLTLSYNNLKPFVIRPKATYHWYLAHIGNMMGGYIATVTAFFSVMISRYEFMNPFLGFALPSLIGVPLLIYWNKQVEKKFQKSAQ